MEIVAEQAEPWAAPSRRSDGVTEHRAVEMFQPEVSEDGDILEANASPKKVSAAAGHAFFTWTTRIAPFRNSTMQGKDGLSQVQKDRGMTMTSNGQLVKLCDAEALSWMGQQHRGWYHKAAIVWSRWTSVEDRFTGHVFESIVGEAVHPSAPMYRCWNTLHMLFMLYPVVIAPLVIGFNINTNGFLLLARIVELTLTVDIIVTFFVAVDVGKTSDHLEQRPLCVAEHYIKTWFLIDLVTSLPWRNLLPLIISKTKLRWITDTVTLRDSLEFTLILRYLTIIRRNYYSVIPIQSMQYKQRAVLSFVTLVLIVSHWMSCTWMIMGRTYMEWYAQTDEDALEKTWLSTAGVDLENDSLQSQYIQSLYFSITIMATIGYGDITPQNGFERTLCIMAMILGTWAYAYCITQLVDMVASWHNADVRFKAHQDDLIEYMRARNLPQGVQKRILKFYDFQRQHAAVFYKEDEILHKLTPNLRAEVTHFAHSDSVQLLKGMKLFENLEDSLLTRLIVALTTQFLPPDELVCEEGELGEVLYIIRKGVISVIKDGVQQSLLTDGQSFGETVLYNTRTKRTATVITRSYCQLMLLAKAAVEGALRSRPQQYAALQQKAKVLYRAHLSRSQRKIITPELDQMDDPSIGVLQNSLSLSRDIHIEGVSTAAKVAGEMREGPADEGGVNRGGQGSSWDSGSLSHAMSLLSAASVRPTNDRPKTFD